MNVTLPQDLEQFVQEKIAKGDYHSPEDAIREALACLRRRDELRRKVTEAKDSQRAGRVRDGDEVFGAIFKRLDDLDVRAYARESLPSHARGRD